ncbi:MAG: hypothetical protein ACUVXB_16705 [Bryobacteraceae bacterium]
MSARASLILQGLLPNDDALSESDWMLRLLDGRYCEIRMLYYIGKDLSRWLEQCLELVHKDEELSRAGLQRESFSWLLVYDPPAKVRQKLDRWGVTGYPAIFRRALALCGLFAELPPRELLSAEFLLHHWRYADAVFEVMTATPQIPAIRAEDFPFELYASGEYARLLEQQWNTS